MSLNYRPTIWERIGGPWAFTLRAYIWTAPIAILLQPVVEPDFWRGNSNSINWFAVSTLGYLAFGAVIYIGNKVIFPDRETKPAPAAGIVTIAILAGIARSLTIGTNLELFGLSGISGVERLPFGAFLGFVWILTASLVLDSKYRYERQLHELITEQLELLDKQQERLDKFADSFESETKDSIETSQRKLQAQIQAVTLRSNTSGSAWSELSMPAYRAAMNFIQVGKRESYVSQTPEAELRSSKTDALKAITRVPHFNIPIALGFTSISVFFGAARLFPVELYITWLIVGLTSNALILIVGKRLIARGSSESPFGFINMLAALLILVFLAPLLANQTNYTIQTLQVFALAATLFEIIWILSSGYVQYSVLNRQSVINLASSQNDRLLLEQSYWDMKSNEIAGRNYSYDFALEIVASDISLAINADEPKLAAGPIQFAISLIARLNESIRATTSFTIESELDRIERNWGQQANLIWTVHGPMVSASIARRAVGVLDICVSKSVRHGNASLISVDVVRSSDSVEISVVDNGHPHDDDETGMGIQMLSELSHGSWSRNRTGGLTKMTAIIN
jgi:signal transduction histidine kinase